MSSPSKERRPRLEVVRRSARLDRIRALAPRYLFVVATSILALLGARALLFAAEGSPAGEAVAEVDHPVEDFAQRFARAYLTFDAARPAARERELRALVGEDLALDAGLAHVRDERVLWTQVAQDQEAIAGGRVIVVAAGVSSQAEPLYLAIPVYRDEGGAVGLAGYPALVGPPEISRHPLADRADVDDGRVVAVVRRAVSNYLASESRNLAADLAPRARVSLPTRELRVVSVQDVLWAAGEGSSAVLATVVARDLRGSEWTLTYEVGIDLGGARPYVTFIETVPNAP